MSRTQQVSASRRLPPVQLATLTSAVSVASCSPVIPSLSAAAPDAGACRGGPVAPRRFRLGPAHRLSSARRVRAARAPARRPRSIFTRATTRYFKADFTASSDRAQSLDTTGDLTYAWRQLWRPAARPSEARARRRAHAIRFPHARLLLPRRLPASQLLRCGAGAVWRRLAQQPECKRPAGRLAVAERVSGSLYVLSCPAVGFSGRSLFSLSCAGMRASDCSSGKVVGLSVWVWSARDTSLSTLIATVHKHILSTSKRVSPLTRHAS